MPYPCPSPVRRLLDLVNETVNYKLPAVITAGKSIAEIGASLDDEMVWAGINWIGVGSRQKFYLPHSFRRWVWTGDESTPPPKCSRDEILWNGKVWDGMLNGKPATSDEIEAAINKHWDYPKTDIEGALRRYNLIRVGRKMLQDIVKLSIKPDPKTSIHGIKLVQGHGEYEIRIVGTDYDEELKEALNGQAARIRKCGAKKCLNYFWFGRSDAYGCSKKCNSAITTARMR
jgi:hypothetical protein